MLACSVLLRRLSRGCKGPVRQPLHRLLRNRDRLPGGAFAPMRRHRHEAVLQIGFQQAHPLAVLLRLEFEPEIELQRTADVDAAGSEFNHCADHRPAREKFGQAVEHQPLIIGASQAVWLLADNAIASPPANGLVMQRTALVVETEEEAFAPAADAGVPVDEADAFGCAEMIGDNGFEREIGPLALRTAEVRAQSEL